MNCARENVVRVNRVKLNGFKVYPSFIRFGRFPPTHPSVATPCRLPEAASARPTAPYSAAAAARTGPLFTPCKSSQHLLPVRHTMRSPGQRF